MRQNNLCLKYLQFKSLLKVWVQCCHPHSRWPKNQIDQRLKFSQFQRTILTLVRRRLKLSQFQRMILTLVRRRLKLSQFQKIILTLVRRRLNLSISKDNSYIGSQEVKIRLGSSSKVTKGSLRPQIIGWASLKMVADIFQ